MKTNKNLRQSLRGGTERWHGWGYRQGAPAALVVVWGHAGHGGVGEVWRPIRYGSAGNVRRYHCHSRTWGLHSPLRYWHKIHNYLTIIVWPNSPCAWQSRGCRLRCGWSSPGTSRTPESSSRTQAPQCPHDPPCYCKYLWSNMIPSGLDIHWIRKPRFGACERKIKLDLQSTCTSLSPR